MTAVVRVAITHRSPQRQETQVFIGTAGSDMKQRHVFSTPNITSAEDAVRVARQAGVPDHDISLIARDDIEKQVIPDDQQETSGDFGPGGMKGLLGGGASGLLAGIIAITVAPLGLTLAGVAAMTLVGAGIGGWVGMLTGTAEPDAVRRTFEDEIAAGRILVVIDGKADVLAAIESDLKLAGASRLPFDSPTAMT